MSARCCNLNLDTRKDALEVANDRFDPPDDLVLNDGIQAFYAKGSSDK